MANTYQLPSNAYQTAIALYNAARDAGASPTNALYLVGSAYQESSFNPMLRGSDSGTSAGLMQINTGSFNRLPAAVQQDPVAQMQAYISAMQRNAPDTWAAMNSAATPQDVYAAQRGNPDWAMGIPGGRFSYADQLGQILGQQNAAAPAQANLSDLANPLQSFGFNPAIDWGAPLPPTPGPPALPGGQLDIAPAQQSLSAMLGQLGPTGAPQGFVDLSQVVPSGQIPNPPTFEDVMPATPLPGGYTASINPPTFEDILPAPVNTFGPLPLPNPPTNEDVMPIIPTPGGYTASINPPTDENVMPVPLDTFTPAPLPNPPTDEDVMPTPVDTYTPPAPIETGGPQPQSAAAPVAKPADPSLGQPLGVIGYPSQADLLQAAQDAGTGSPLWTQFAKAAQQASNLSNTANWAGGLAGLGPTGGQPSSLTAGTVPIMDASGNIVGIRAVGESMHPMSAGEGLQGMAAQAAALDTGDITKRFLGARAGTSTNASALSHDFWNWFNSNPTALTHAILAGLPVRGPSQAAPPAIVDLSGAMAAGGK